MLKAHIDTYEEWRQLLLAERILSDEGTIDLVRLERKHPDHGLDEKQLAWIEAIQQGRVTEKGEDVPVEEEKESSMEEEPEEIPVAPASNREPEPEEKPEPPKAKKAKVVEPEPEPEPEEEKKEEEAEDEDLAPPPLPGETRKKSEEKAEYEVGQTLKIQVEEDGDPEEVTVAKIAKDGIHLQSSKDEETEYLVDPEELAEMIV